MGTIIFPNNKLKSKLIELLIKIMYSELSYSLETKALMMKEFGERLESGKKVMAAIFPSPQSSETGMKSS